MKTQAHKFLTDQGCYVHTHMDGVGSYDEFDLYEGDSHDIILQRGKLVDQVLIDWDQVRFFENGGQNKTQAVVALMRRPKGVTREEVLVLTKWPSISMQALAKSAGVIGFRVGDKQRPFTYHCK
jgi:hypothetical protein